jgi:hypothetical protein
MTIHDQWTALYAAGRVRWMPWMRVAPNVYGECGVVAAVRDGSNCIALNEQDTDGWPLLMWASTNYIMVDGQPKCEFFPDFADPATIGCLLHQAREAWGDPGLHAARVRVKAKGQGAFRCWRIFNTVGDRTVNGSPDFYGAPDSGGWYTPYDSEPAAILAAIAAAPPKVKP